MAPSETALLLQALSGDAESQNLLDVHMVLRSYDIHSMRLQGVLDARKQPVARCKASNQDDVLQDDTISDL